jgi:two-component system, NarL family, invasion response regulator UvrY
MLKTLICDDHAMIAEGLSTSLSKHGIEVVGYVSSSKHVIERYLELQPDVMILDVRFAPGEPTGLQVASELLKLDRTARIVFYTQFDDEELILASYRMRCLGFVTKSASLDQLVLAIERAAVRKPYYQPEIEARIWSHSGDPDQSTRQDDSPQNLLDSRELAVFKLLALGYTHEEILEQVRSNSGKKYHIRTMRVIVSEIKRKLNIQRTAAFTLLAVKHSLIDPSSDSPASTWNTNTNAA